MTNFENHTTEEIIIDLTAINAHAQNTLRAGIVELAKRAKECEAVVPPPEDPDTIPGEAKPPEAAPAPQPDLDIISNEVLHADMSREAIAKLVSTAKPGTRFEIRGDIGALNIGGANKATHAAAWVDRPLDKLLFEGATPDDRIGGLTLRSDHGGFADIRFKDVWIRPQVNGDFAAIRSWKDQIHLDSLVSFTGVHLFAPLHWTSFDGFGMKWGMHTHGMRYVIQDMTAQAAREHTGYDINGIGSYIDGLENFTRKMPDATGDLQMVGNGRTLWQWHERIGDGPARTGDIYGRRMVANYCGHEGLLGHGGVAQGGSCITIGGAHKVAAVFEQASFNKPFAGCIATWAETGKTGPNGFSGFVDAAQSHAIKELTLRDISLSPSNLGNRTAILLSSIGKLTLDNIRYPYPDDIELDHQDGVLENGEVIYV